MLSNMFRHLTFMMPGSSNMWCHYMLVSYYVLTVHAWITFMLQEAETQPSEMMDEYLLLKQKQAALEQLEKEAAKEEAALKAVTMDIDKMQARIAQRGSEPVDLMAMKIQQEEILADAQRSMQLQVREKLRVQEQAGIEVKRILAEEQKARDDEVEKLATKLADERTKKEKEMASLALKTADEERQKRESAELALKAAEDEKNACETEQLRAMENEMALKAAKLAEATKEKYEQELAELYAKLEEEKKQREEHAAALKLAQEQKSAAEQALKLKVDELSASLDGAAKDDLEKHVEAVCDAAAREYADEAARKRDELLRDVIRRENPLANASPHAVDHTFVDEPEAKKLKPDSAQKPVIPDSAQKAVSATPLMPDSASKALSDTDKKALDAENEKRSKEIKELETMYEEKRQQMLAAREKKEQLEKVYEEQSTILYALQSDPKTCSQIK